MPRANRYFVPGHVWHLTHRCHRRDFLLKFARDRRCWAMWLFETRRRYGLTVLNYVATCNHVHLLVSDAGADRMAIPHSMQLLAGRVAQEYNLRKRRNGSFWEDRYHATAVETGRHLRRCMTYIDLNMVRAGVVRHPEEWEWSGYVEIQNPPERYRRIDRETVARVLGFPTVEELCAWQRQAVVEHLAGETGRCRRPEWTESVAVGDVPYLERVKMQLGSDALHRAVQSFGSDASVLREVSGSYTARMTGENGHPSDCNAIKWELPLDE